MPDITIPENPVGTKEQREKLRRMLRGVCGPVLLTGSEAAATIKMADGLDIAQEMRQRLPPVRGCKCKDCEAGRKWDKWRETNPRAGS